MYYWMLQQKTILGQLFWKGTKISIINIMYQRLCRHSRKKLALWLYKIQFQIFPISLYNYPTKNKKIFNSVTPTYTMSCKKHKCMHGWIFSQLTLRKTKGLRLNYLCRLLRSRCLPEVFTNLHLNFPLWIPSKYLIKM